MTYDYEERATDDSTNSGSSNDNVCTNKDLDDLLNCGMEDEEGNADQPLHAAEKQIPLSQEIAEYLRQKISKEHAAEKQIPLSQEIAEYLRQKISKDTDPLLWWKANKKRFPRLQALACKYLAEPATSASSERSFSSAGTVCSKLRNQLTGEHVEALNMLYRNKAIKDR